MKKRTTTQRVRVTIELGDDLHQRAKIAAADRGTSLRNIVEKGLRLALRENRRVGSKGFSGK
jgi:predicted HicB family RNase H-like nuclease